MTDRIYEAADVLGIQLVDHVIIGNNQYTSIYKYKMDQNNKMNIKE